MSANDLPEHVRRNREEWDRWATDYATWAPREWAKPEPTWGMLNVPDADVRALPESVEGMDIIELGCGTAYFSGWLAMRGAKPVGIDNSPQQLETARRMQNQFDIHFPLRLGNAEALPFPDASFDLALSEYGASIWCDPYRWLPEAARVLRPGGQLIFLVNGLLAMLCTTPQDTGDTQVTNALRRPYFGVHRFEWPDDESVSFHIGYGEWIRLFRANGMEVENLIELQPPAGSERSLDFVPIEWARQWPAEEIWIARKR